MKTTRPNAIRSTIPAAARRSRVPVQTRLEFSPQLAARNSKSTATPTGRILRLPQVCELIGLKKTMIYQMEAEARFPKRVRLGSRAVGWLEDELRAWLHERVAARDRAASD